MTDVVSSHNQWSHNTMPRISQHTYERNTRRKPQRSINDISSRTTLRKIILYRNGDRYFTGKQINITPQNYLNLRHLLQELSSTIDLPYGVRRLFTPHNGSEISDINILKDGASYVCASFEPFQKLDYTSINIPRVTLNTERRKYDIDFSVFFIRVSNIFWIKFTFSSLYLHKKKHFSFYISFSP